MVHEILRFVRRKKGKKNSTGQIRSSFLKKKESSINTWCIFKRVLINSIGENASQP